MVLPGRGTFLLEIGTFPLKAGRVATLALVCSATTFLDAINRDGLSNSSDYTLTLCQLVANLQGDAVITRDGKLPFVILQSTVIILATDEGQGN